MRAVIYLKDSQNYIVADEGTGDNLLDEDVEQGYKDYIMANVYRTDGLEFEEIDGGQIMLDKYVADMEEEEFIERVLKFFAYDEDYIVLE